MSYLIRTYPNPTNDEPVVGRLTDKHPSFRAGLFTTLTRPIQERLHADSQVTLVIDVKLEQPTGFLVRLRAGVHEPG